MTKTVISHHAATNTFVLVPVNNTTVMEMRRPTTNVKIFWMKVPLRSYVDADLSSPIGGANLLCSCAKLHPSR